MRKYLQTNTTRRFVKNTAKSVVLQLGSAFVFAFSVAGSSAHAQALTDACINNAISNGSFVTTTHGSMSSPANITNWNQSAGSYYWFREFYFSRPGLDQIVTVAAYNQPSSMLYTHVTNAAVENDSITINLNLSLLNYGSDPQLNVYWSPDNAPFDANLHLRGQVALTSYNSVTATGFNGGRVVNASIDKYGSGLVYFSLRVPYSGSGPASGTLQLMAEVSSGTSGDSYVGLFSAFMNAHTCSVTNAPPQEPFICGAGYGYLSQDVDAGHVGTVEGRTRLLKVDLATGDATLMPHYIIDGTYTDFVQVNALAYNRLDDYLWAHRAGTQQIVRIGSDGTARYFNAPELKSLFYAAGDIDANGIYYLYHSFSNYGVIERIDLNSMTMLPPLIVASELKADVVDLAINPVDGWIYVASKNNQTSNPVYIQKIDPVTGAVTTLYNTSALMPQYPLGAVWFDVDGNLYASQNVNGHIWKFTTEESYIATFVDYGPATSNNDGARCPIVPVVATVNISGKVWNDINMDAITTGGENGINPGTLYANLVDDNGLVVGSVLVDNNTGAYQFNNVKAVGIYKVVLTNSQVAVNSPLSSSEPLPGSWEHTGVNVGGIADTSNTTGIISGITTSGQDVTGLDFGIVTPNPVSVNLVYFEVTVQNGEPNLKWQTAEEQNNRGFEIERSPNGMDWTTIGFVGSIAHKGSSVGLLDYSFSDRTPLANKNFYRLKQLDNDGNATYSYVRMVNLSKVYNPQVAPNPASDVVIISGINGGERIAIYDITGSLIKEIVHTEGSRQVVSLTDMNAGVYYIHILSPNLERKVLKLVKQVN